MPTIFKYAQYQPQFSGTIADLLQQAGQIRANQAQQVGQAQARAAEIAGQARAATAGAIGQGVSSAVGTIGQMLQQRKAQQQQASQQDAIAKILHASASPDGTYDVQKVTDFASQVGLDPRPLAEWVTKQNTAQLAAAKTRFEMQPKSPEPFTLGPGQQRFNSDGTPVATVAPNAVTVSPGASLVSPQGGEPIYTAPSAPPKPPTAESKYLDIQTKRNQQQPLTPDEEAFAKAYERNKTLVSTTNFTLNQPGRVTAADAREQARLDRSYQLTNTSLEALRKPLADQAERMGRLVDSVNQRTPQADALVAPELLTVMAGGMGSGLRMNEAEISRIVGGRTNLESLKAALNKWQTNPAKGLSITDSQRAQIRSLISTVQERSTAKLDTITQASQALIDAPDVETHRKVLADVRKRLTDLSGNLSVEAVSAKITVRAPDGSTHDFDTQAQADTFKKLAGIP